MRSVGGDYDPGSAVVTFEVTNQATRSILFKSSQKLTLPSFEVGFYPADATCEEIQEIVFKETEEMLYPILGNWIEVAALRAIRQEGSVGAVHVPRLKKMLDDPWTNEENARRPLDQRRAPGRGPRDARRHPITFVQRTQKLPARDVYRSFR